MEKFNNFMHKMSSFEMLCLLQVSKYWGGLSWCSIPSSFQNNLKTSGHRGCEFLEFWNLFPFFSDIGFQLLKSSWSSLVYLWFNGAPNVLYS